LKDNSLNWLDRTAEIKQPIRSDALLDACKVLGERDAKGYGFECYIYNLLLYHGFSVESNPLKDPKTWKRNIGSGPDFRLRGISVEIEAKNVYAQVWRGSILPNYISRFSGKGHSIVCVSDLTRLPSPAIEDLKKAKIKVTNPIMLIQHLYGLVWKLRRPHHHFDPRANSITSSNTNSSPFPAHFFSKRVYSQNPTGPPGQKLSNPSQFIKWELRNAGQKSIQSY
jgi:hypothetical protein